MVGIRPYYPRDSNLLGGNDIVSVTSAHPVEEHRPGHSEGGEEGQNGLVSGITYRGQKRKERARIVVVGVR